ncbi:MAG: tyrosine-type recombinase/integrase [Chloroflexi bacterium]|nr:tyrosine-type recombinase/integrase [Chloroflexota bacterium]
MVNKMTISQIAALTNFDKSYFSKVINGEKPASLKLLEALNKLLPEKKVPDYLQLFLQSRQSMGVSSRTIEFYEDRLGQFIKHVDYLKVKTSTIDKCLASIPANVNGLSTRHASYRATFYRWLNTEFGFSNPINSISAPILGRPIMPTLDESMVHQLIGAVDNIRDIAIIALFVESGLRLSELANIKLDDINWTGRSIRVQGKGRKTAFAPFGIMSKKYLKDWLSEYNPDGNIWGMTKCGIAIMLARLEKRTGITCNPHTFRRIFAVL